MVFNTFRKIPVLSQYLISGPSARISWSLRQISFFAKFFKRKPLPISSDLSHDKTNSISTDSQKPSNSFFTYQGGDPVTCYHKPPPLADYNSKKTKPNLLQNFQIQNPEPKDEVERCARNVEEIVKDRNIFCLGKAVDASVKSQWDDVVLLVRDKPNDKAKCCRKRFPKLDPRTQIVCYFGENNCDFDLLLPMKKPEETSVTATEEIAITKFLGKDDSGEKSNAAVANITTNEEIAMTNMPRNADSEEKSTTNMSANSLMEDHSEEKSNANVSVNEEIAITNSLREGDPEVKSLALASSVAASEEIAITNSLREADPEAKSLALASNVAASEEIAITNSLREGDSEAKSHALASSAAASKEIAVTNSLREGDSEAKSNACTSSVAASKETAMTNSLREDDSEAKSNACISSVAASKEIAVTNSLREGDSEAKSFAFAASKETALKVADSEAKSNASTSGVAARSEIKNSEAWKDDSISKAILLIDDGICIDEQEDLIELPQQVLNTRSVFVKEKECQEEIQQSDAFNCAKKFSMRLDSATLKVMAMKSSWNEQEERQPQTSSKFESAPTRSLVEHILRKEVGNAFLGTRYLQVFPKANYSECGRCGKANFQGDPRRRNRRYEFYDSENASGNCNRCKKFAAFESDCECCQRYEAYKDPRAMTSKEDMPDKDEQPYRKTEEELYEEMCKKNPTSCVVASQGQESWDEIRCLPKKKKTKKFVRRPPKLVDQKMVAAKKACIRKKISSVKPKCALKPPPPKQSHFRCIQQVIKLQPPEQRENYLEKYLVQPKKVGRFFSNRLQEAVEPKLNSCRPAEIKPKVLSKRRAAGYLKPAPFRPSEDDVRNEICRRRKS